MKNLTNIFILFGDKLEKDFSNVHSIDTKIIPNKDDIINLKSGSYLVTKRYINYSQVDEHDAESHERGGESIYIFTDKL